jgi:hypothetical protein
VHFAKTLQDFRALLLCANEQTELEAAQNVANHREPFSFICSWL